MFKTMKIAAVALTALVALPAQAGGGGGHIEDVSFSFEGPFGTFDQAALQRGYQVYAEVCAACHGLKYVAFRTLGDEGGPAFAEDQVKAIAASFEVPDPEGKPGATRPGKPSDKFPTPEATGNPPDLSLITKARAGFHGPMGLGINQFFRGIGGPEYVYAVLTGYDGHTEEQAGTTLYGNHAFPGGKIGMPPPLTDGAVTYADGTEATVKQMARDVTEFLTWAAEPKMEERKKLGTRMMLWLALFAVLLWFSNKKLWKKVKTGQSDGWS